MIERYILEMLSQDKTSVSRQTFVEYMGQEYPIGDRWTKSYMNSVRGRNEVIAELPQTQVNAIMAVWGDSPTVEEVTE